MAAIKIYLQFLFLSIYKHNLYSLSEFLGSGNQAQQRYNQRSKMAAKMATIFLFTYNFCCHQYRSYEVNCLF